MRLLRVLVTSGGTSEKIDDVRKITNSGTGELGSLIANRFVSEHCIEKLTYLCTSDAVKPEENPKIRIREADSVLTVEAAVKGELETERYDIIVHAMAISDYMIKAVVDPSTVAANITASWEKLSDAEDDVTRTHMIENVIMDTKSIKAKKISSDKDALAIVMTKAPKIIESLRTLAPAAVICGFKLLSTVSENELIKAGTDLIKKNKLDLVLANDMNSITGGAHKGLLVNRLGGYGSAVGKAEIADMVVTYIIKAITKEESEMNETEKNILKTEALRVLFRVRNVTFVSHKHGLAAGTRGQRAERAELNMAELLFMRTLVDREKLPPAQRLGGLKEMTKFLCISKAAMSQMTKSMIRRGLITSERNPHDERSLLYHMTEQGYKMFESTDKGFDELIVEVLNSFGWDEMVVMLKEVDRFANIIDAYAAADEEATR